MLHPRLAKYLPLLAAALFLLVSWTPDHYWDEFFYLFSAAAHSPRELVRFEPHQTLFPNGFFTGKIGHVVLLHLLLGWFGPGRVSLITIQAIYAVMVLAFSAAAWGLLRELLGRRSASRSALVLLFLPVTTYLGYKTLSEVPSMLFVTLGCWSFLRGVREDDPSRRLLLLGLAALGLAAGALCRVTGMLTFVGLALALYLGRDPRFSGPVLIRSAGVLALSLSFYLAVLYGLGGSLSQLAGLAYHVASRRGAGVQRLYALALTLQMFALVLPWGLRRHPGPAARISVIWLAATALPCLAVYEPRYYAPALIPLAVLAAAAIWSAARSWFGMHHRWGSIVVLSALVLANRLVFAPLMPYEIDQARLTAVMQQLQRTSPGGSYLVPWISDWAFLRVAFPRATTLLCMSAIPQLRYTAGERWGPMPPSDRWWVGSSRYVGSLAALEEARPPWYYIGWTFSPSLLRLRERLEQIGIHWADDPERAGWHDHLAGSWVWRDPSLALTPLKQQGQYHVFRIQLRGRSRARPKPGA